MSINEVRYLPECGSTNAYMKEHFEEFGPVGAVYTTNQTAGRGRLGRTWVNAEGKALYYTVAIKEPLESLATKPGFGWMQKLGPNMVSIFIIFALLYWVGMARIVRSQVLTLKESEYVTAARALGASGGRIIKKHLLTNCMGTLIVTTTLQIPSSIFTESYLSFLGLGVAAPMPSLGSLATDAVKGMNTYPVLLIAPALMISIMILVFNLFGDGLRDAFDPKLKS